MIIRGLKSSGLLCDASVSVQFSRGMNADAPSSVEDYIRMTLIHHGYNPLLNECFVANNGRLTSTFLIAASKDSIEHIRLVIDANLKALPGYEFFLKDGYSIDVSFDENTIDDRNYNHFLSLIFQDFTKTGRHPEIVETFMALSPYYAIAYVQETKRMSKVLEPAIFTSEDLIAKYFGFTDL